MKKLTLKDILGPSAYERVGEERRRRVIGLKRRRRVHVGPTVSMVFENRETMTNQIEEMVRAEKLDEPAKIQEEIDVYNAVLPDDGQLAATLFIEVASE